MGFCYKNSYSWEKERAAIIYSPIKPATIEPIYKHCLSCSFWAAKNPLRAISSIIVAEDDKDVKLFKDLGICEQLVEAYENLGWKPPSKTQAETIPHALEGECVKLYGAIINAILNLVDKVGFGLLFCDHMDPCVCYHLPTMKIKAERLSEFFEICRGLVFEQVQFVKIEQE